MKRISYLFVVFLVCQVGISQTKSELQQRVVAPVDEKMALQGEQIKLKTEILDLKEQILLLKNENQSLQVEVERFKSSQSSTTAKTNEAHTTSTTQNQNLTSNTSSSGRCQAITTKGTQCSRTAEAGSNYCWQHKSMYESSGNTKLSVSSSTTSSSSSSASKTIYTGPRGGRYYINSKGNKVYIKK